MRPSPAISHSAGLTIILPGLEVVGADGRRRFVPDPVATAKGCQRGIGDRDALRDELFVDADQIARQRSTHSRIWSRYGSAFSARSIRGTVGLPALSTVRTAPREICKARAIWGIPWPFARKLKIAVRSP